MNFDLTEEQRLIQDTAREFAIAELEPAAAGLDRAGLRLARRSTGLHQRVENAPPAGARCAGLPRDAALSALGGLAAQAPPPIGVDHTG